MESNTLVLLLGFFLLIVTLIWLIIRDSKPNGTLHFVINFPNIKLSIIMADIKNNQFVEGTLVVKDAKGDNAEIEAGSVNATSSDENVFTVEKDPENEKKIKVVGQRAGAAILTISADADLGEGVKTIETQVAINVLSSEATGFSVEFGEAQEQ